MKEQVDEVACDRDQYEREHIKKRSCGGGQTLIEDQIRSRRHGSVRAMAVSVLRPCLGLCGRRRFFGTKSILVVSFAAFFNCPVVFRFHRTAPLYGQRLTFQRRTLLPLAREGPRAPCKGAAQTSWRALGLEPGADDHDHPYNKSFICRRKDQVWAPLAARNRTLRVFSGESCRAL